MARTKETRANAAPGAGTIFALRAIGLVILARWLFSMSRNGHRLVAVRDGLVAVGVHQPRLPVPADFSAGRARPGRASVSSAAAMAAAGAAAVRFPWLPVRGVFGGRVRLERGRAACDSCGGRHQRLAAGGAGPVCGGAVDLPSARAVAHECGGAPLAIGRYAISVDVATRTVVVWVESRKLGQYDARELSVHWPDGQGDAMRRWLQHLLRCSTRRRWRRGGYRFALRLRRCRGLRRRPAGCTDVPRWSCIGTPPRLRDITIRRYFARRL